MTPGLAGPPFPSKAKKGAVVCIASTDSPTVPLVVGICNFDISDLHTVQGAKGHAVETLHWSGDELWLWSTNGRPGIRPPESLGGWQDDDGEGDLADKAQGLISEDNDEDGGVSINQALRENDKVQNQDGYKKGDDAVEEELLADAQVRTLNTQGRILQPSWLSTFV